MILYHTSNQEIRKPDIHHGRKNADFGWGFYLTPDREFACRWAKDEAIVNIYELDLDDLSVHRFSRSPEWFEYIFYNRRLQDGLNTDVVIGPIANDTIFDTLGIISSGFLTSGQAAKLLMIGPEYTQLAIKTEKAAAKLKWLGADKIERADVKTRKAEQEAYQEKLAEELEKILDGDKEN